MDGSQFDAWTRRRLGLASGAAFATALGVLIGDETEAKNKKRKKRGKRCKRLFAGCTPGGKRKCCNDLKCRVPYEIQDGTSTETHCCYLEGDGPCSVDNDCCFPAFCFGPGGECVTNSDRNLKTNFASIDPANMLARVTALPISTWSSSGDDPSIRHIGPKAQDFAALFGVGMDDRQIHPVDGQGVALAAIQGLAGLTGELRDENTRLAARLSALEEAP